MTDNGHLHTQEILAVADEAYHNGEGRIAEAILPKVRGDGLATFIRDEIKDVTFQVFEKRAALMEAEHAILRAKIELDKVAAYLRIEIEEM